MRTDRAPCARRNYVPYVLAVLAPAFAMLWFAMLSPDSAIAADDGIYAITAKELSDGGWSVPHLLAESDPTGAFHPYRSPVVTPRGFFLAPRHAVWSTALGVMYFFLGDVGLRTLPILGTAAGVGASALLARLYGGRTRTAVLAAGIALCSPLLYHGLQLSAHAMVAAAIAFGVMGAHKFIVEPTASSTLIAMGGCMTASALRSDGFIFALAIVGVFAATAAISYARGRFLRPSRLLLISGLLFVSSSAAYGCSIVAARRLTGETTGSVSSAPLEVSSLPERMSALANTAYSTPTRSSEALGILVAITCLMALAVVKLRRGRSDQWPAIILGLCAIALALRTAVAPMQPATGLIGAWPILLLGAIRPWRAIGFAERMTLGIVVLGTVGVAMTQYSEGGGLNWGGRFLAPTIPLLAATVASSIHSVGSRRLNESRLVPATAVVAVTTMLAMLLFDAGVRLNTHALSERLDRHEGPKVLVTSLGDIPARDWGSFGERQWLRAPGDGGGMRRLLAALNSSGIDEVTAFGITREHRRTIFGSRGPGPHWSENGIVYWPITVKTATHEQDGQH